MSNFQTWYKNADMPAFVNGAWEDAETGLTYKSNKDYKPYISFQASDKVKAQRAFAKQFGGKALAGTSDQKPWAEDIRAGILSRISAEAAEVLATNITKAEFWINARQEGDIKMEFGAYALAKALVTAEKMYRIEEDMMIWEDHPFDKTMVTLKNSNECQAYRKEVNALVNKIEEFKNGKISAL